MPATASAQWTEKWSTGGFDTPESVLYDSSTGYIYASNINGDGWPTTPSNNGYISRLNSNGSLETKVWLGDDTGGGGGDVSFDAPKGMAVDGSGNLYVADVNNVRQVPISNPAGTVSVHVDPSIAWWNSQMYFNDVALAGNGIVYASNSGGTYAGVFSWDPSGANQLMPVDNLDTASGVTNPNGLHFHNGQLLIGSAEGIIKWDPDTETITPLMTGYHADGIGSDSAGNIYFSAGQDVYRFQEGDTTPTMLFSIAAGGGAIPGFPADISYAQGLSVVLSPNFGLNTVSAHNDPSAPAQAAPYDFNGDGESDVLYRHSGNGNVGVWLMDGTTEMTWQYIGNHGTSWDIGGVGDFNADGQNDVIYRHSGNGGVGVWLMNGTTEASWQYIGNHGAAWDVKGVGDFNGDNSPDVVYRNDSGMVGVWLMNGTTESSWTALGNHGTAWDVKGVGDFNGDDSQDVVYRNTNGMVGVWLMNGTTENSWQALGNHGTSWEPKAVGDYNADGSSDVVYRNTSGMVGVWLMNGTTENSWQAIGNHGVWDVR